MLEINKVTGKKKKKKITLVFFLACAFVGSFQPVDRLVQCDVTFPITSYTLDSEEMRDLPSIVKAISASLDTRIESLPVGSAGLLSPTLLRPGVHPEQ